jgi:peptide/nickel transport system ATP-binding protein
MSIAIKVSGLNVRYKVDNKVVNAVNNVSFSLDRKKILGIIGETGSGKSSLIRSLNGLIKEPGIVEFKDLQILDSHGINNDFKFENLRGKKVGFIPQNPFGSLNPIYKISKQFEFVNKRHKIYEISEFNFQVLRALKEVGINDPERVANSYSFELSGGMAQRVVIALANFSNPEIIFADEPTTGLDVTVERQLLDKFFELVDSNNLTLIIVTHDLGIVAQYCDETIVMLNGEIVEKGSVMNVFKNPQNEYTQKLIKASNEEIS